MLKTKTIMRHRLFFLLLLLLGGTFQSNSQDLLLRLLTDKAFQAAGAKGTKLMESLDSVDFQFAVSVNENAGFFDIEQKGETKAQLLYQQKLPQDKTVFDIARDTLEKGVEFYGFRRYEKAEETFRSAVSFLEQKGLTNDVIYLRSPSKLGLVSLTQARTFDAA